VARLPINAPSTLIAHENVALKLFSAATRLDIETESEFFGRYVLLHTVRVEPELLAGLARFAAEFPVVVASLVKERWPPVDAIDDQATDVPGAGSWS
jgi:elongation factor P--beta-lysine ligase